MLASHSHSEWPGHCIIVKFFLYACPSCRSFKGMKGPTHFGHTRPAHFTTANEGLEWANSTYNLKSRTGGGGIQGRGWCTPSVRGPRVGCLIWPNINPGQTGGSKWNSGRSVALALQVRGTQTHQLNKILTYQNTVLFDNHTYEVTCDYWDCQIR